jgi:DNA adenine methylase
MKDNLYSFLGEFNKKEIEFTCFNFDDFDFSLYTSDDYIYCDPPYLITSGTYNDGKRGFTGWGSLEEKKLLDILSKLDERGVKFGLSNVLTHKEQTNTILQQWIQKNNFYVWHLNKNYSNSNYQSKAKTSLTDEVFISNYKPQSSQFTLTF